LPKKLKQNESLQLRNSGVPATPFFNPLQQSVESVVSLMSKASIGSINISNVQNLYIHNNLGNNFAKQPNAKQANAMQANAMQGFAHQVS